jgi:hypothetical protein
MKDQTVNKNRIKTVFTFGMKNETGRKYIFGKIKYLYLKYIQYERYAILVGIYAPLNSIY